MKNSVQDFGDHSVVIVGASGARGNAVVRNRLSLTRDCDQRH